MSFDHFTEFRDDVCYYLLTYFNLWPESLKHLNKFEFKNIYFSVSDQKNIYFYSCILSKSNLRIFQIDFRVLKRRKDCLCESYSGPLDSALMWTYLPLCETSEELKS